jgi:MFS family permease
MRTYRDVLAHPGALAFSLTGLVARLPISMAGLGIVLLVEAATGSYGLAGSVSAAYMVANAVLAILQGRLLDRWGQGPVLAVAGTVFGAATAVLVWSVEAGWPLTATYVAAAVAGGSLPQIGSAVRARWAHVLDRPAQVQTAYALEAVFDEVVFILGPILVTVLATLVDPVLGLAVAAVAGSLGAWGFAAQRATAPPAHGQPTTGSGGAPLPWRTLVPLTVVSACLGVLFGAAEVTTVAFADEEGAPGWAGGLLALWALGSLLSGVVTGAIAWRRGPAARLKVGAAAMACAMAPLPLVGSLPVMGLVLLVGGAAIAPTLIASMSLVQTTTPRARLTEGMAMVQTGLVAGVAPGAAASGFVVDQAGASAAYLVSLGAGLLAVVAALALPRGEPSAPHTAS